jgi:hypothetical protein
MLIQMEDYRQRRRNGETTAVQPRQLLRNSAPLALAALELQPDLELQPECLRQLIATRSMQMPWPTVAAPQPDELRLWYAEATLV